MLPFVSVALATCDKLEIIDRNGQKVVMRFAKMYSPEKMGKIIEQAKSYPWHLNNPTAAFMKAVGEVNKKEKEANGNS